LSSVTSGLCDDEAEVTSALSTFSSIFTNKQKYHNNLAVATFFLLWIVGLISHININFISLSFEVKDWFQYFLVKSI
jgi:hypothetical protein